MKFATKEKDFPDFGGVPCFDLCEFDCSIWVPSKDFPSNIIHAAAMAVTPVNVVAEMKHNSWLSGIGGAGPFNLYLTLYLEQFSGLDPAPVPAAPVPVMNGMVTWDYPEVVFPLPVLAVGTYKGIVTVTCTNPATGANLFHAYEELGVIQVEP